jgi:hypothetical protein
VTEGIVTILFTDVEGSTALPAGRGDAEARAILGASDELVRPQVEEHGGRAIKRLATGDAAAGAAANEAVEVARRQGARVNECAALLVRAQVAAAEGAATEVVGADLDAALALATGETGALTYEPFIREALGRLRGDEREVREALRLYTIIDATGHARRLGAELAGSRPYATADPDGEAFLG